MKKIILVLILLIFTTFLTWEIYYNQPLNRIELNFPETVGKVESIGFSLPKGKYIIIAEVQGEPQNEDSPRNIRYQLTIPGENIEIDNEAQIDFGYKVKENHRESFEVRGNESKGKFFVELLTASQSNLKIKLIIVL